MMKPIAVRGEKSPCDGMLVPPLSEASAFSEDLFFKVNEMVNTKVKPNRIIKAKGRISVPYSSTALPSTKDITA